MSFTKRASKILCLLCLALVIGMLSLGSVGAAGDDDLLGKYEIGDKEFMKRAVTDKIIYWHQRMIDEAIVGGDYIRYEFDKNTKELIEKDVHWRDDLPEHLPPVISREEAESMVEGEIQSTKLYYIPPDAPNFPIEPMPKNPCWVVWIVGNGDYISDVIVIDAVEGKIVGHGVPPPSEGYSLSGPKYTCYGVYNDYYYHARNWFKEMGYPTDTKAWPSEEEVKSYIQNNGIAMFYEIAHGDSQSFWNQCYDCTTASEVEDWIEDYAKMPFTFLASCNGMCDTGSGTLSYAFRKGSTENTCTVGYCGMGGDPCKECWNFYSLHWQGELFEHMAQGDTVKEAFDEACDEYPMCENCMRFAGDADFAVVPVVQRALMEGDTNLDLCVDMVDALFIAQYKAKLITLNADQLICSDTTDEGVVDMIDALHIAQWRVDSDGTGGVLFKPLWESPADDDMLQPDPCRGGGKGQAAGKGTVVSIPDAGAIHGSNVTVPISIDDVSDLGAIEIWLSYNSSVVEVAAVANGTLGSLTYAIFNDNGVTKMAWFSATGETGNFTFANVTLRAVGSGDDASALNLTVIDMVDSDANPISYGVDDGTFTVTPIVAETSLGQELKNPDNRSSVIWVPVNIDRAKDGVTGENISGIEIDSYNAEASYLYDPPDGMEMLKVDPGDAPFDDPASEIHNNDPGDDWTEFSQDPAGSAEAPLSVARLVVRLIGSAYATHNLTVNFDSIMATIGEELVQESPAVATYQRGDACEDGEVTMIDATWIGQYLVGSRSLDELGALNAACPSHDVAGGDKITMTDALFIAQFCSGARDEYYELTEGSKGGASAPIASGKVTAELPSAEILVGRTVPIPIIVKGIPADSAGLGCYDLKLTFNPKVVRVDSIKCDGIDFARPTAVNIDNAKGVVLLNGFQSSIPGPAGDVTLAYLAVTVTGSPGDSGVLDVEITTLADIIGNDIIAYGQKC